MIMIQRIKSKVLYAVIHIVNLAKQGYCNHFVCLCVCLCVCVSVCVSVCPR